MQWPRHRKQSGPSAHDTSPDWVARSERLVIRPNELEIADPLDLVVIGDTGRAAAKSDFRAKVKMELAATAISGAAKCSPSAPLVDRERPLFLRPLRGGFRRLRFASVAALRKAAGVADQHNAGDKPHRKQCPRKCHRLRCRFPQLGRSDRARFASQFEDVHAGIGAIDDVDVATIVGLDVVGLDGDLTAVLAV